MSLPSREDINVHDSLDERVACKHFLGKSLDDAYALFRENWLYHQENLMWMGPKAFRFYLPAAIRYLQSADAMGGEGDVMCFVSLLEFRMEYEREELRPVAFALIDACEFVRLNWQKYENAAEIREVFETIEWRVAVEKMGGSPNQTRGVRKRLLVLRDGLQRLADEKSGL
mgnify:CR=1 FL=1